MNEKKTNYKNRKNKHIICNSLLILSLISVIANFTVVLLNNKDILTNIISSTLLSIFVIFYIISSITNTRKNKKYIIISSIVLILFNLSEIGSNLNISSISINSVPDFTDKSLIDVIKWSEKNKVKINQVYEFSDTIDEYKIINQSKKDVAVKKIKELTVSISEGANPDKEVVIPDMETWEANRVLKFIKKNFLSNVNTEFVISDKNKDTVIEQSTSGTIKRSDPLTIIFSLGEEEGLEDVKLIDLTNKTAFEAEFYLKRNAIIYDIERDFSNKITRNNVIGTNKEIGSKIKPNNQSDKLILKISKGKKIKVPDLTKYSMLDITEWVIKNKLKLEFTSQYDDSIKTNKVIAVNYNKDDVIEEKTLIKVTISKGKLVMLSFDSLDKFKEWANKYNINYEEKFEFSDDVSVGNIINCSHKTGDTIKNDDLIIITISQGKKTKVPNIIGNTKTEAIKKIESAKIKYNIVYENSEEEKNKVIKQSLTAGSEVAENITLTITLSNGKKPSTKQQYTTTNNNTNQSNNNQPSQGCDKSKTTTVVFQGSLNGSSLNETASNYRNAYPNVKFQFIEKANNYGDNGMVHPDSISKGNFEANYCDTYTIYIIKR